jgi:hypothetical protein
VWSRRKGRTWNLSRYGGTTRLSSNWWLVTQTKLDWPKLGNLIPCLGLFNVLSGYEYWLCKTQDLRDVLSAWFAAISEQSYFGGWIIE